MATVTQIRDGLAVNLATISGLRSSSTLPDNPSPPIAIVGVSSIEFDKAFQRGLTTYNMLVSVLVSRVDERSGQDRLDGYLNSAGTTSIKAAIESDRTLGSAVCDVRCSEVTAVNNVTLGAGDITYLAADFAVQVYAE